MKILIWCKQLVCRTTSTRQWLSEQKFGHLGLSYSTIVTNLPWPWISTYGTGHGINALSSKIYFKCANPRHFFSFHYKMLSTDCSYTFILLSLPATSHCSQGNSLLKSQYKIHITCFPQSKPQYRTKENLSSILFQEGNDSSNLYHPVIFGTTWVSPRFCFSLTQLEFYPRHWGLRNVQVV